MSKTHLIIGLMFLLLSGCVNEDVHEPSEYTRITFLCNQSYDNLSSVMRYCEQVAIGSESTPCREELGVQKNARHPEVFITYCEVTK